MKHINQEYYVGFAQDEWHIKQALTLNYGLRYDYYAPLHERDNRIVKFNIDTGTLDPDTTPFYKSSKTNFQPRISATYTPMDKTVLRGGLRHLRRPGPDRGPDSADRGRAHQHDAVGRRPGRRVSGRSNVIRANFINNPNNRSCQPRAYSNDYSLPERVYQYRVRAARAAGEPGRDGRVCRQPGTQPVPAQHREPDHRRADQRRGRGDADSRVRHRHVHQRRERHGHPVPGRFDDRDHSAAVRRDRLQDERRLQQLQLDAAFADASRQQRRDDERAVRSATARATPAGRTKR